METSRVPALVASLIALCGCSGEDTTTEVETSRLEIMTWWGEPTEIAALDALIAVHTEKHPNVEVSVLRSYSRDVQDGDVQARIAQGNPPTAFLANLGGHAKRWAESAQPLNERAAAGNWASVYAPGVLDLVTVDGDLIGVPLAITRQNNVYYNKRVLDRLDMNIPEGHAQFIDWLGELEALGYTHPLCVGDEDNWVSALVLFEDMLPASGGAEFSHDFWTGRLSGSDPAFLAALDYAASLMPYFNGDLGEIGMGEGVERLMKESEPQSQCLMTAMGDWGGTILSVTYVPEEDFVQRAWPGAEDIFVLGGDAFITTRGVNNQQEAFAFFDTLASLEGQIAFNAKKGSVPAHTLEAEHFEAFGPLTRRNIDDYASSTALASNGLLGASTFPWGGLTELTHDFFLSADPEPIVDYMNDHYGELVEGGVPIE
jgi:glucose/mannose transport system substrate-binding protein